MRISDWSSDVCSSDLFQRVPLLKATREREGARFAVNRNGRSIALRFQDQFLPLPNFNEAQAEVEAPAVFVGQAVHAPALGADRSEEHTSELQSLMRISYAVFCLKKKKHTINK